MTQPNPPAPGADVRPAGRTKLITKPNTPEGPFTANQETDVDGAVRRALAEYLEQVEYEVAGRRYYFRRVYEEWAEPEEKAAHPTAVILPGGTGSYAAKSLTPTLDMRERLPPPDNRYLVVPAEWTQEVIVEVWGNDPEERMALSAMVERALNPVFWKFGFVLEMPHYFNARAVYSLRTKTLQMTEENSLRRFRIAAFVLQAIAPLVTLYGFPDSRPRFELQAVGPDVEVGVMVDVT